MEELQLVPDAHNLMESTRSIGYSLPAAVADIIDNSIAAKANKVYLETPQTPSETDSLWILDDGKGMSQLELITAMKYGSRSVEEDRDENDLGRFGLGLKMASLSQCRCLTVISRCCGGDICGARWDLDHIANNSKSWSLLMLNSDEMKLIPGYKKLEYLESGTLVVWQKLDVLVMGINKLESLKILESKIADLKKHLSLVFHRLLTVNNEYGKDNLTIIFNGRILEPMDPFLMKKSTKPFEKDSFELGGEKIWYQPYILPHPKNLTREEKEMVGDLQKEQGFYIYRNKRLIIWGTWFRLSRKLVLSKLARVMVDFPVSANLDKLWSLDVKKSSATVPQQLRESLRAVVDRLGERSEKVWTKRARTEQSRKNSVWLRNTSPDGEITYQINKKNTVIAEIIKRYPEIATVLTLIENRLPLDSVYSDLSNEKIVDQGPEDKINQMLEALGFRVSENE